MTGVSGAGKSTIPRALKKRNCSGSMHTYRLDDDNLRHGLNASLGLAPEDRAENIQCATEVAKLMADAGTVVIASFIPPYGADRGGARAIACRPALSLSKILVEQVTCCTLVEKMSGARSPIRSREMATGFPRGPW